MSKDGFKMNTGDVLIRSLLAIVILLIVFYLVSFFLSFEAGGLNGVSIAFLGVLLLITAFSVGVLFVPGTDAEKKENLLKDISFASVLLSFLTIITAASSSAYRLILTISIIPVLYHISILLYFMKGIVESRSSFSPERIVTSKERRSYVRIKGYATEQRRGKKGEPSWFTVGVYDASGSGIRFITREPLEENQDVEMKIYIAEDRRPIYAEGKVIWRNEFFIDRRPIYHIGIKFAKIDPQDRARLIMKQVYNLFQEKVNNE